jgi:hypothetical protein
LLFFFCASLHAQVTIGGLEKTKAGAVLDLNSTSKGGLLLSNVSIENFFKIPSTFHGGGGEDTALKEGLTGAMIYNTNPDFCTGVHVWNGQHWGRIATTTPVPVPGALSITSDSANLMGGDEVEFTASSDAKTYKWFASINGDPYEYLGITTTSTFSKIFSPGTGKVKVIMDDCRSVKESEVSFNMNGVLPNFGSEAGGNYVYIYGDFPYAATDDYTPAGLVSHYDGINNRGQGDKRHDYSSTASWKDLKNPTFDLLRGSGKGKWLSNGFQALDNDTSFASLAFPDTYPLGNAKRTVEVIFRTPDEDNMFEQIWSVQRHIFMYGKNGESKQFGVIYRGVNDMDACSSSKTPEKNWIFYAISGYNYNLVTCLSSTPSLTTANTINTVTSTYGNSIKDENYTNSYINNIPATVVDRRGTALDTQQGGVQIGQNLSHSTFLSIRLYDRVLSSDEIKRNAELDQIRYLNPPAVTIDGVPCTEVVVLSSHFLMCKVPAGSIGAKDVEIKVKDKTIHYAGAYEYVSAGDFYVSSISPIIGSVNDVLTLEGNKLNEISEVRVGGALCTNVIYQDVARYECELPSNPSGEVDITIKLIDETVYRFAKVFEYQ